ncbi:hypothetical protein KSP40_PGU021528 [Platanthera guangdongensis]|uniref:SHSP domain-containing protein n=1 Tax=Platanthera guangdongensis TaxID=2320717 RepID=A0ABR2LNX0_9ASPA
MAAATAASLFLAPSLFRQTATFPRSTAFFSPLSRSILRRTAAASAASEPNDNTSLDVPVKKVAGASPETRSPRRSAFEISPFGLVDPLSPLRTMRQMLDTMDRIFDGAGGGETRSPWEIREEEQELKMRFDMPGLTKEEVKVTVEDDVLVIKSAQQKEKGGGKEGDDGWWRWSSSGAAYDVRLVLPEEAEKEKVKAEFKNGVLLVTVPKKKVERHVFDIEIK